MINNLSPIKTSKLAELKQRLLFVFLVIVVYRIGAHIPVPGLDPERLNALFNQQANGILGLLNMFSGGALSRLTVFALGIMPYISASIVMQLLTAVSPRLEQLKKEGEEGRRKINRWTRYGTLVLAFFQGIGMSKLLLAQSIALYAGFSFYFTTTLTLVAGTMFLMWLGEQATERGIGSGISLIIFSSIVSRMPSAAYQLIQQVKEGQMQFITLIGIILFVFVVTSFVIFVERAQRRITVNYAQRMQANKIYAAQKTHLPLKINMAGVIPPIFASSIIILPATILKLFSSGQAPEWVSTLSLALSPGQPLYLLIFAATILFFAFFYTALVFNPKDTADNLKRSGAFLPGIRPGEQTANYIDGVMTRLTLVGALYLVFVSLLPETAVYFWHVPFYFGGTSLLIVVMVVIEFMAQTQSHIMSYQYESLLKKGHAKNSYRSMLI